VEPRENEGAGAGTDKSVPRETVERRDRLGRELGLVWIGVFVVAAVLIAVLAWLLA
jgi:hypothetical protein